MYSVLDAWVSSSSQGFVLVLLLAVSGLQNTSELLFPGGSCCTVLAWNPAPHRKTDYTLILVENGGRWVCIHSVLANQVAYEYLNAQSDVSKLKKEVTYGKSRFDLACYRRGKFCFYEVKSVNLVVDNIVMFPGAPTERGSKHLAEIN